MTMTGGGWGCRPVPYIYIYTYIYICIYIYMCYKYCTHTVKITYNTIYTYRYNEKNREMMTNSY